MCCDLEVDVNGEHIFFVDKKILAAYSNRFSKLSAKLSNTKRNPRVIFYDFPGGAESFELIASFCYNNGNIDITPFNIFLLRSSCTFMEIDSLMKQTELYLDGIHCWTSFEFLNGLKQCQILFPFMKKSHLFQDFLNTLLGNLVLPSYVTSSFTSSSNSSSFRFPSSEATLCSWQINDLSFLNIYLFEKLIKSMILQHFDHPRICSLIFHYQKSHFFLCSSHQKCDISQTTINLLCLLNGSSFSCRALFDAYGMILNMNLRNLERKKLETLLGSRLDEFTINDLLIRGTKNCAFDVGLTLRLVKVFLLERKVNGFFLHRAKKVGLLIDLYMAEVAPDPFLKPSKFAALAKALPDFSRVSHDRIYHAIDLYLEVHYGLSDEQTKSVFSALDIKKLSLVTLRHLARNAKFVPFFQPGQFMVSLQDNFGVEKFICRVKNMARKDEQSSKILQNTRKFMLKKSKSRPFDLHNAKSLPRLCH